MEEKEQAATEATLAPRPLPSTLRSSHVTLNPQFEA